MRSSTNSALRQLARRSFERVMNLPAFRDWLSRRARVAWEEADSVAFVCLGNICRSPFAEGVARRRSPGRQLLSAGTLQRPGRPSPPEAVASARGWGVDLGDHRSQPLTPELAAETGALFVFDFHNLRRVLAAHPRALRRVHPIGALAPDGPLVVADPDGGDAATFDETYRRIADAVPAVGPVPAPRGRRRRFARNPQAQPATS